MDDHQLVQFNQQGTLLQTLMNSFGARTEATTRWEATLDAPVHTPSDSNTSTHPLVPTSTNPVQHVVVENPRSLVDSSIIKTQLPLIQPRPYKGERKDNACEQWCMDMHSFMRRYETLTGRTLSNEQAVEYIFQCWNYKFVMLFSPDPSDGILRWLC